MNPNKKILSDFSRRTPSLKWGGIRAIISLALFLAVLQRIDFGIVVQVARSLKFGWILSALLLAGAGRLFAASRWYLLLIGKSPLVTFGRVVRLVFVSSFLGMFLPGGVGVEIIRIYGLSKITSDVNLALSSIFVERIIAIWVLTL